MDSETPLSISSVHLSRTTRWNSKRLLPCAPGLCSRTFVYVDGRTCSLFEISIYVFVASLFFVVWICSNPAPSPPASSIASFSHSLVHWIFEAPTKHHLTTRAHHRSLFDSLYQTVVSVWCCDGEPNWSVRERFARVSSWLYKIWQVHPYWFDYCCNVVLTADRYSRFYCGCIDSFTGAGLTLLAL